MADLSKQPIFAMPAAGERAPFFHCRTAARPDFAFDTVAGRNVLLAFLGSTALPASAMFIERLRRHRTRFDDVQVCFFGVIADPADLDRGDAQDAIPGMRYFLDFDRAVATKYAASDVGETGVPKVFLLDRALRVIETFSCHAGEPRTVDAVFESLAKLPRVDSPYPVYGAAPALVVPRVFESGLCRALIDYYVSKGGAPSGFMRDVDGRTRLLEDPAHKRRRDCAIEDEALRKACAARILRRLIPEIEHAFHFRATRMERYIVACYDAADEGHFRAHRDNTTHGTAHRRFAVSLFLNAGEYEGGFLRFPEFGSALYTAPAGGAVVFSCSMLHEATPVTRGRRMMFLPFLYDEAARRVRDANLQYLAVEDQPLRSPSP
jgi:predicted 2-oxoglutarate/Fe(II)-dependent dioxygenase YbiX/peroxiredoxin